MDITTISLGKSTVNTLMIDNDSAKNAFDQLDQDVTGLKTSQSSIENEISQVKADITVHEIGEFSDFEKTVISCKYLNRTGNLSDGGTDSLRQHTGYIEVDETMKFMYSSSTVGTARQYALFDENKACILNSMYPDKDPSYDGLHTDINKIIDMRELLQHFPAAKYVVFSTCDGYLKSNVLKFIPEKIGHVVDKQTNGMNLLSADVKMLSADVKASSFVEKSQFESFNFEVKYGWYIGPDGKDIHAGDSYPERQVTELFPIDEDTAYMYTGQSTGSARQYAVLDKSQNLLFICPDKDGGYSAENEIVDCNEMLKSFPTAKYIKFSTTNGKQMPLSAYVEKRMRYYEPLSTAIRKTDMLSGKKYLALGDSFTSGNNFNSLTDEFGKKGKTSNVLFDKESKQWKSYPWLIADRCNMELFNAAHDGEEVWYDPNNPTSVAKASHLSLKYQSLSNEISAADYITFSYGINDDMGNPVYGDKDSTEISTVWGAWNTVLSNILSVNPDVKIGIIIYDGAMTTKQHDAQIEIAKWWGIPYLDIKNDPEVPAMMDGRLISNPVNPYAKSMRNLAFKDSSGHPNYNAHTFRSTVIESFLKRL